MNRKRQTNEKRVKMVKWLAGEYMEPILIYMWTHIGTSFALKILAMYSARININMRLKWDEMNKKCAREREIDMLQKRPHERRSIERAGGLVNGRLEGQTDRWTTNEHKRVERNNMALNWLGRLTRNFRNITIWNLKKKRTKERIRKTI